MPFDLTILSKKIEGLKEAFENGKFGDALGTALNAINFPFQRRVFEQNTDIEGNGFGQYIGKKKKITDRALFISYNTTTSKTDQKRIKKNADLELTSYQRLRANKGRQISKKDLEFTGGLRRAIETQVQDEKSAVLEFNNDEAAKIARGQENQITNIRNGQKGSSKGNGIKIFGLNTSEKEQVVDQGAELIKQILSNGKDN